MTVLFCGYGYMRRPQTASQLSREPVCHQNHTLDEISIWTQDAQLTPRIWSAAPATSRPGLHIEINGRVDDVDRSALRFQTVGAGLSGGVRPQRPQTATETSQLLASLSMQRALTDRTHTNAGTARPAATSATHASDGKYDYIPASVTSSSRPRTMVRAPETCVQKYHRRLLPIFERDGFRLCSRRGALQRVAGGASVSVGC